MTIKTNNVRLMSFLIYFVSNDFSTLSFPDDNSSFARFNSFFALNPITIHLTYVFLNLSVNLLIVSSIRKIINAAITNHQSI